LAVLLQLSDQLVSLLDNILVLLVLVIRTIRLDDTLAGHAIDCARNAAGRDEFGQVTIERLCQFDVRVIEVRMGATYRSKKSTVTPKSLAMLSRPTTR
jgi:hypothetical protein